MGGRVRIKLSNMNKIEIELCKIFLKHPLKKCCPYDEIIISGPGSELNDCFYVKFYQEEDEKFPSLFITEINGDKIIGKRWDDIANKYSTDVSISLKDIKPGFLEVTNYHKGNITVFSGLWDFVINRITRAPYVYAFLHTKNFQIQQFTFNQKLLDVNDPIMLLEVVRKYYLDKGEPIGAVDLLVNLYELKAVGHPDFDATLKKIDRLLNLYTESNDLLKRESKYQITGQGIKLLEQHQYLAETRIENLKLQKQIRNLTCWILFFTFIMVGLGIIENWQFIECVITSF
ncbi:MAG: hypothetical protein HRT90_05470 [Candidatus Margulisbacteria bacterium]|nr:hypothetical protein [Candidatus Margulisiibacteriota bacterium]